MTVSKPKRKAPTKATAPEKSYISYSAIFIVIMLGALILSSYHAMRNRVDANFAISKSEVLTGELVRVIEENTQLKKQSKDQSFKVFELQDELQKLNIELRNEKDKGPKVVEKVVEKEKVVKVQDQSKIIELRRIIIRLNQENDSLRDRLK